MKKNLILGIAMSLGVTATAFANANPFSDVPAGHWAYDAVAQLQAAGVVEGYGATFGGDKLATRYEMAQIVAKAMAKGANVEKLAAEFADELDSLGVRVAAVEKKVDNVKITGQVRYSYRGFSGDYQGSGVGNGYGRLRTRLFVNGHINDEWAYTGMLENDRQLANRDANNATIDNDKVTFKRAYLDGRVGGVRLSAGRKYFAQPDMIDAEADGVEAKYKFGVINATGWAMRNVNAPYVTGSKAMLDRDRIYMAKVDTKVGVWTPAVQYWVVDATAGNDAVHTNIWQVGTSVELDKGLTLTGNYYRGTTKDAESYGRNGWELGAKAYGAKANNPGTCGFWVNYMDRPGSTFIKPTALGTYAYNNLGKDTYKSTKAWWMQDGYRGWELGANWAVAKNVVATARYFDLKGRSGDQTRVRTYWTDVTFSF